MSLVPYSSRDSREIVLRHDDAIVIRDPQSKQLILRGTSSSSQVTDCPYCHQPLRAHSPEREPRASARDESFVSPEYFRMLHLASESSDDEQHPPSSPIRRLTQPAFPISPPRPSVAESGPSEVEFVTSAPAATNAAEGQGIKRDAFSPNYFQKFFTEERELGRGGKGVVLLVRHELDGVFLGNFACKRVPVGDDHAWLEKVLIEVQLLQRLSHPNLVSYRHVWLEDVKLNRFGPSVPCAFILQQYCNAGDLLHYVVGDNPVPTSTKEQLKEQMRRRSKGQADRPKDLRRKLAFEEIYSFFKDITSGLAHLHASNYIHRDLKPSNCLLHRSSNDLRCLISDFGEVQAENIVRKSTGATGTISYCAPEVLKKDALGRFGNFSTKSDIFSLGMILYFLCFARLPYSSADIIQEEFEDLDQLRAEISTWSGFQDERKERPELPDQLYEFLKRLLALSPPERPSADEILHAIRTGSGLASPPRVGRTGSGSLGVGKRIQPIDSPAPGSPAPGKSRVNSSANLEDARDDNNSSARQIKPKGTIETLVERRRRSQSPHIPQTPLLMPPPVPGFSGVWNQLAIYRHDAIAWAILNHRVLILGIKISFFVIKVYSLSKPCLPLATNPIIAYPLLMLAALDLILGISIEWRVSVLLVVVHFAALAVPLGAGGLCAGREQQWNWEAD